MNFLKRYKPKYLKYFFENNCLYIFTLVYFATYSRALFFGFVEDDYSLIALNYSEAIDQSIHTHHFRPLMFLSYPAVNAILSNSAFSHHFVNIMLQYINSVIAIFVFSNKIGRLRTLAAAIFWNLLPWAVFPIVWISQRNDLLMTFFLFISIYFIDKGKVKFASLMSFLGFLSKVTSLFFPIFIIYKSLKLKKSIFYGFLALFTSFSCAWWGFRQYPLKAHLQDLPSFFKVLNYCKNWLHGWFSILFPIPFFTNLLFCIAYILSLYFFMSFLKKNFRLNEISKEYLIIAFLMSLTTAVNPELRVVFLQSFFIIIFLFSGVQNFSFNRHLGYALFFYLIYLVPSNYLTQNKFDSKEYSGNVQFAYMPGSSNLYLNSYYSSVRDFLVRNKKYLLSNDL